jgi:hypothetical protein
MVEEGQTSSSGGRHRRHRRWADHLNKPLLNSRSSLRSVPCRQILDGCLVEKGALAAVAVVVAGVLLPLLLQLLLVQE